MSPRSSRRLREKALARTNLAIWLAGCFENVDHPTAGQRRRRPPPLAPTASSHTQTPHPPPFKNVRGDREISRGHFRSGARDISRSPPKWPKGSCQRRRYDWADAEWLSKHRVLIQKRPRNTSRQPIDQHPGNIEAPTCAKSPDAADTMDIHISRVNARYLAATSGTSPSYLGSDRHLPIAPPPQAG